MKPPSGSNKTNPNKANFKRHISVFCSLESIVCCLQSVLCSRMKPKLLNFHLKNSFDSLAEFGKMLYMLDVQQF